MSEKIGAVITGGDFQGLGLMRTLAEKGIPIKLLDSDFCIGRYSKYKKQFYRSPHPSEIESYLDFLINLAKKESIQGWVIFPNSDESIYVLSKYKEILKEYYRVSTPSWDVIQNVYIKKNTYQIAEQNGIPIPKMYNAENIEELLEMDLQFPLVIKPSIRDHFYNKIRMQFIS